MMSLGVPGHYGCKKGRLRSSSQDQKIQVRTEKNWSMKVLPFFRLVLPLRLGDPTVRESKQQPQGYELIRVRRR